MSTLDPQGAAILELMLDVYDRLLSQSANDRRSVFQQACQDVRAAIVETGRISPDACSDLLAALGERAGVTNARAIVRSESCNVSSIFVGAVH
jgi:hypothetical protein